MTILKKILSISVLHIFLIFPLISFAQQTTTLDYKDDSNFPKGKMGEVVQKVLQTINANDANKISSFITKSSSVKYQNRVPMERYQEFFLSFYRRTGGINFHSMRTYTPDRPNQTVVIVKDNNFDSWLAITLDFKDKTDYIIKDLWFASARTPSNITESNSTISETELIDKTNVLLDNLAKKDVFSGTILIAKGGKVLYEKAFGEASKRFHVANTIDTKLNLGSMNKMFTATAIMQLVEKDKVALNDPISNYIDETWLPKKITDKITVHHLLSHTSGLGSYFNKTYWESSRQLYRTVEEFKPLVKGDTLAFTPGEKFRYSNTGMLLLGVVIQKSTGQDYFDYIRENIYKPAGMNNSDAYEMDQPVENLAIGYSPKLNNDYGWENNIYKHVIKGGPAGGGFSTVRDLQKFALALTNEKLVSKSSLDLLWKDHAKSDYGYGFGVKIGSLGKVVGHNGGFPGLNSGLDIFLDSGYIVAVMSNYDGGASPVSQKVYKWIEKVKK